MTHPRVQVAGVAEIFVDSAYLGLTRDGAHGTFEGYWVKVSGDENGGDEGPPIEIQFMGETARVRLEMTKWDPAVSMNLQGRVPGGIAGRPYDAGRLVFANGGFDLLIFCRGQPGTTGTTNGLHFPMAVPEHPIELNKGTKFSTLVVEFMCYKHPRTGILYNNNLEGMGSFSIDSFSSTSGGSGAIF